MALARSTGLISMRSKQRGPCVRRSALPTVSGGLLDLWASGSFGRSDWLLGWSRVADSGVTDSFGDRRTSGSKRVSDSGVSDSLGWW